MTQEESTYDDAVSLDVLRTGARRLPPAIRPHSRLGEVDPGMDLDTSSTRYRENTGFDTRKTILQRENDLLVDLGSTKSAEARIIERRKA